jgi:hypothetical protein
LPQICRTIYFWYKEWIENRIRALTNEEPGEQDIDPEIVRGLKMLDGYNPLVKIFRQARDFLEEHKGIDISIRIVGADKADRIQYVMPH